MHCCLNLNRPPTRMSLHSPALMCCSRECSERGMAEKQRASKGANRGYWCCLGAYSGAQPELTETAPAMHSRYSHSTLALLTRNDVLQSGVQRARDGGGVEGEEEGTDTRGLCSETEKKHSLDFEEDLLADECGVSVCREGMEGDRRRRRRIREERQGHVDGRTIEEERTYAPPRGTSPDG